MEHHIQMLVVAVTMQGYVARAVYYTAQCACPATQKQQLTTAQSLMAHTGLRWIAVLEGLHNDCLPLHICRLGCQDWLGVQPTVVRHCHGHVMPAEPVRASLQAYSRQPGDFTLER